MEQRINGEKRFALVIDADNVSARYVNVILDELSKYGTVTYKRIYGDWTSTLHSKWKNTLLDNSITPIQQFSYTQGKNATDHAMIIDAMDILYTGQVDGFCIVSSDSDFTRLAARIRESGLTVIGMGEKKTPLAFRKACDIFTTLELLIKDVPTQKDHVPGKSGRAADSPAPAISKERIEEAVIAIVTYNQNNGKDTGLGEVGSRLQKRYPDFDVRNYGTNQLRKLLESFDSITVTKEGNTLSVSLTDGYEPPATDSDEAAPEDAFGEEMADAAKAADDASAAEVEAGEEGEEAPKKKSRRGKRGGRRNKAKAEDELATENAEAEGEKAAEPNDAAQATAEVTEEAAAAEAETAEDAPKKSHRGTRRRSSKINTATEDEATEIAADESAADEAATEEAPAKKRPPRRPPVRRSFEEVAQKSGARTEALTEERAKAVVAAAEKVLEEAVAAEAAAAAEAEAAPAEEKPKRKRSSRSKKAKAAEAAEAEPAIADEAASLDEPAAEEKPKRKRSSRSKKAKAAEAAEPAAEDIAVVAESAEGNVVFSWPPSDEVTAALEEQTADASAPAEPAPAAEEKPKRKRSSHSKKAKAETPDEPAAEPADTAAAEEKPKRKRTSRSKKAKTAEAAEPASEPAPAGAADQPKPTPDIEAVRAYVRAQQAASPDITPAALGKKVHSKFRGFKLSDNGFRTFKDFLKTV